MIPKVPSVPEEQRTDAVVELLEIIRVQQETIRHLRDEIARLKGQKPKPDSKPSTPTWPARLRVPPPGDSAPIDRDEFLPHLARPHSPSTLIGRLVESTVLVEPRRVLHAARKQVEQGRWLSTPAVELVPHAVEVCGAISIQLF